MILEDTELYGITIGRRLSGMTFDILIPFATEYDRRARIIILKGNHVHKFIPRRNICYVIENGKINRSDCYDNSWNDEDEIMLQVFVSLNLTKILKCIYNREIFVNIRGLDMSILEEIGVFSSAIKDIKSAIIEKGQTPQGDYSTFADAIRQIKDVVKNQNINIVDNGTYVPEDGYTGFEEVKVSINKVNNTDITISPKTTSQSFTPLEPYTGYDTITVNPVTYKIDSNIKGINIKSGVSILGVDGLVEDAADFEEALNLIILGE